MTGKRVLALALALAAVMSAAACGEVDESSSEREKAAAVESEKSEESKADEKSGTGFSAEYEFAQKMLGMDTDTAKGIIKSTYPETEESTESMEPLYDVTIYIFEGRVEFIGEEFDNVHFAVDNAAGKVISLAYTAKKSNAERPADKLYEALLEKTTAEYSEPEHSELGDEVIKEYNTWKESKVSLQYMHSEGSDLSTVSLVFEDNADYEQGQAEDEKQKDILGSAESLEYFEQLGSWIYEHDGQWAIGELDKSLGISHGQPEVSEDRMNAIGEYYNTYIYNIDEGFEVLGQRFYTIDLDCGIDDKMVNTVGFHMNTDINTTEGHTPTPFECKEAYESIYAMLTERYGEPSAKFTPEVNDYFGALWIGTPCGDIWIAWAEKIFHSEQADMIISFSTEEINGV